MSRPVSLPLTKLPSLEEKRHSLETCVFCPKLCRSACPVSNAEPTETLTPWGKMSMSYFAANGSVAVEPTFAAPTWGCTGCHACKGSCDHKNDVASTLLTARAAFAKEGVAPAAAMKAIERFPEHQSATADAVHELSMLPVVDPASPTAVLVGCTYARGAIAAAKDAVSATAKIVERNVSLTKECCGLPLLLAGDPEGFKAQAQRFAESVRGKRELVVVDAGCAMALKVRYAEVGVTLEPRVEVFLERAMGALDRMKTIGTDEDVRYHDPCQLSRGLGVVEPPRAIRTKLLGKAPLEFPNNRGKSVCSGGGGLVPVTMPETAKTMAKTRTQEHDDAGGGKIVTACASSLLQFRRAGADAEDIASWINRGLA